MQEAKLTLNETKTEMTTKGAPRPQLTHLYTHDFNIMGAAPQAITAAIQNGDLPDDTAGTPH